MRDFSVLSLGLTATLLSACSVMPTQSIPNGYRYQDPTPLSSPAPSRPWLADAARPNLDHIGDETAAWQGSVYELISPLPSILPPESTTITLREKPPHYPAESAFDHYLRQGLASYGYTVNPTAENAGTVLIYNAAPLTRAEARKEARKRFGKEFIESGNMRGMYYLTLDISDAKGNPLNSQATIAVIPHDKNEYRRWPGFSTQPTQGRGYPRPVYDTRD